MKTFEHITEKEILYYAIYAIYEKLEKERNILEKNPEDIIAPFKISKFKAQYEEINKRIIEIERNEK